MRETEKWLGDREKILTAPQAVDPVSVMCYMNNKFSFTLNKNQYLQVKKKNLSNKISITLYQLFKKQKPPSK